MENIQDNPFFEEFDKADVINRYDDNGNIKPKESDPVPEYNNENDVYRSGSETEFKSFLVLKNISGVKTESSYSNYIPAGLINDTGQVIEISNSYSSPDHNENDRQKVIVNRDDSGSITRIEITCSCGEITTLSFEEEDDD